ncbi:tetracycline transporter protein [Zea mays]|uniref:Major facilitator superfamily protein n=1 Tax=Zea mays TaxID=4577 RepID=B4F9E5_MAIZE|nr:tetracycline transporter protein [Zea mays]ACF78738.1 unknown [Zea mays]ACN25405.1 unknown [Zea mays]ONL99623.1 Major facilitator superfamily protein [Zea mays]|eukprot:NP_001130498.1 tetracycline transporter protein [Zea mays]
MKNKKREREDRVMEGLGHLLLFAFLFWFSTFMVAPVMTDVTMAALCPGRDECSLAIYLTGLQQAVSGLGALVLTPVVGNLSDRYGRKALLALPATASIVPLGILAYGRTKGYFYAYYVTKTLTAMVCEGTMMTLSLAYVADRVPETRRAAAFGVFSGVCSAGFVGGTVAARFLPVSSTFQVSAVAAVATAVYMKAFLQETDGGASVSSSSSSSSGSGSDEEAACRRPLCLPSSSSSEEAASLPRLPPLRKAPSLSEIAAALTSSSTFCCAAVVTFFHGLGETGLLSALLYFLKAKFHYSKNQYANLLLIIGITGSFSQLTVMPLLVRKLGEQKLLVISLVASCGQAFLYSISWSSWVPYLAASSVILSMLVTPCIRSIVSKKVGPFEQGMVQGCMTGISSTASVVSPLIFTPLTAWCLSEATPFYLKGFSVACAGFATLVALATSISMRPAEVQPDRK